MSDDMSHLSVARKVIHTQAVVPVTTTEQKLCIMGQSKHLGCHLQTRHHGSR